MFIVYYKSFLTFLQLAPFLKIVVFFQVPTLPELDDESRIERRHWGEIGSDEDSSEESEEEEEGEGGAVEVGFVTPATTEGLVLLVTQ